MENDNVRRADELLFEFTHRFRLYDYLNPVNRVEEKEKFLFAWKNGGTYQPQFEYKKIPPSLEKMATDIASLNFESTPLSSMFRETRDEISKLLVILFNRGKEDFTQLVIRTYEMPKQELVDQAKRLLKKDSRFRRPVEAGVKALSEILKSKIREERIEGWEISEDPLCVDPCEVDSSNHKIRLQTGLLFSKKAIRRLRSRLIHVNLYRCLNGERQPYKMMGVGMAGAFATEEGIAMNHEEKSALLDSDCERYYAGKTWAFTLALRHSFYGVFSKLENYFDLDTAYSITESVKRGLVDTAQTGGWIRDHTCFLEQKKISHLHTDDLQLLYTGRVSVHHLPIVKEMIAKEWLIPPAFLPKPF